MSKYKVFVTRRIPQVGLDRLSPIADLDIWPETLPPPYEVLQSKIPQIDGLLCLLTDRIDGSLIEAGSELKVISQMAVGYDNIHMATATERKIPVGHTPGVLTDATADFAWALLMAAGRRVVAGDRYTRAGSWQTWEPQLLLGPDITGATLGIIGLGRIGFNFVGYDRVPILGDKHDMHLDEGNTMRKRPKLIRHISILSAQKSRCHYGSIEA